MKLALLVRSYNRPNYLRDTLDSLLRADIDLCCERVIYDDGSIDPDVIQVLTDPARVKVRNKEFRVIRGSANIGCKNSYIVGLNVLKNCDFICTVDNDVHVKPNFIGTMLSTYNDAYALYGTNEMLLTGFDSSNTHRNCFETYPTFYRKRSCGGVCFFFHKSFKPFIISAWGINLDWGVVHLMDKYKYPLLCTRPGVVQHIGAYGLNSSGQRFDHDDTFGSD
jgi:glycosyltransferase involved in cell wall biosynthesis